jgi:hypothetical protein
MGFTLLPAARLWFKELMYLQQAEDLSVHCVTILVLFFSSSVLLVEPPVWRTCWLVLLAAFAALASVCVRTLLHFVAKRLSN